MLVGDADGDEVGALVGVFVGGGGRAAELIALALP